MCGDACSREPGKIVGFIIGGLIWLQSPSTRSIIEAIMDGVVAPFVKWSCQAAVRDMVGDVEQILYLGERCWPGLLEGSAFCHSTTRASYSTKSHPYDQIDLLLYSVLKETLETTRYGHMRQD